MQIRILLIVQDPKAEEKYLEALKAEEVQVFVSPTLIDFSEEICRHTYHGIFLDLSTKMKALRHSKNYIYGLQEKFPICQLKYDETQDQIKCITSSSEPVNGPLDFVRKVCGHFVPQPIRSNVRKAVHLDALLYRKAEDTEPERSVTMDICQGGCFLFSTGLWELDNNVWIQFLDLDDSSLILGEIRSVVLWGESHGIPGIGVEFKSISPAQVEEIYNRFLSSD